MTRIAGPAVLAALLALSLGAVGVLALSATGSWALKGSDWAAIRFTLWQAFWSATLSCLLAVPLARALMRRRFPGRRALIGLLGAPFLLPVIVAILGLLAVWGRTGVLNDMLAGVGLGRVSIYGLQGILLAHVFFNLPLAARLLLFGWARIPETHFRLADQLGFDARARFRWLELPMLRAVLPGAFLLIFLLCMTSFTVALALGGGPAATTIELAIYQALRFSFDIGAAVNLALIQFALAGGLALLLLGRSAPQPIGEPLDRAPQRAPGGLGLKVWDSAVILAIVAFLATPMLFVLTRGARALANGLPNGLVGAVLTSLSVALASALIATGAALTLAFWIARLRGRSAALVEGTGLLMLAASPFVIGTGLYVLLNRFTDPFALALPITAVLNAAVSLPFALRALVPPIQEGQARFAALADSLGMAGWSRFRLVLWPVLRPALGFALGLSAAFSMGDLGVITLFAPPGVETLPLFMYRLMGAYRMEEAFGAALVLLLLSLALFWIFDRGGRLGTSA